MDLKQIFISNLRKYRNDREISQMRLAELCDTATNYIGQIEIGRRFPSLKLIEKIGKVLEVEPYMFFIDESDKNLDEIDRMVDFLSNLPDKSKLTIINRISMPSE
jgi:transcriptional regulator with XRE-family HTH domain